MTFNIIDIILFGIYISLTIGGLFIVVALKLKRKKLFPDIHFSGEDFLKHSKEVSIEKFIPSATSRFLIYSGEFNSDFYDDEVLREFNYIIEEKGVEMRAVYGPAFDIDCINLLKMALVRKIKLYRLKERIEEVHFRVIDGRHVCMDKNPHPPFGGYPGGGFWFNNFYLGRQKEKDFEILMKDAEYMSPKKILEMIRNAKPVKKEEMLEKPCFVKHDKEIKPLPIRPATGEEIEHLKKEIEGYIKRSFMSYLEL